MMFGLQSKLETVAPDVPSKGNLIRKENSRLELESHWSPTSCKKPSHVYG